MADSIPSTSKIANVAVEQDNSVPDPYCPEARFECPICLAWLRNPVLTSCGHRFCRDCIESWLERNLYCPVDNLELKGDSDIFPDNFTRREISQQRTKCPNIVRGCLEELSPIDVDAHLLVCQFKPPELPDNEKLRCNFVNVGCDEKFEDEPELQRHLEQHVQKHLTLLSQAYTKLTVNNEATTSTSAIAQEAAFWDPPSKSETEAMSSTDNVNVLLKAAYEKNVILEQKVRELEIIICNMSDQLKSLHLTMAKNQLRYCNGSYLWYLTDFTHKLNQMRRSVHVMHYSPGFYTSPNGYKLCVRMNLSRNDSNYLGILIHMMKTDHDNTLHWPFSGRLCVILVHPTDHFKTIKETMMTRPELEAFNRPIQDLNPRGFGYSEFALIDTIISDGYIRDNQLIIKVIAQPV